MSTASQPSFVRKTQSGLDEVRINSKKGIEAPFFTPEISGPEDLLALLNARPALEKDNPIIVPGYRWQDIRSKPMFKQHKPEIKHLISNHPFYYYEPVELFRFTMPMRLVTHAFQGNRSKSRDFYKRIRKGDTQKAVSMLPEFFQPFLEAQLTRLYEKDRKASKRQAPNTKNRKIYEAWRDKRADQGYTDYFEEMIDDAQKSPNVTIIPPVPPILGSSGQDSITRTRGVNRYMTMRCNDKSSGMSGSRVYSYFHLYIDQGIFKGGNTLDKKLLQVLENELQQYDYAGVAITISNYNRAWKNNVHKTLEKFVTEASNIARQNDLPVILPRSKWFGAYLTDCGVQSFSIPMNGHFRHKQRATGGVGEKARYGKVALYGDAYEANIGELETYLKSSGGQVHNIQYLPSKPPTFAPNASSWKGKFGKARKFRIEFSKPRRLTHVQEAREFRQDIKSGVPDPVRHYLTRSQHAYLS